MSTDSDIIRRSRASPAEFGALFDRHARIVFRYVAARAGAEAADEVLSETFVIAFEQRLRFDLTIPDARPWLLGAPTRPSRRVLIGGLGIAAVPTAIAVVATSIGPAPAASAEVARTLRGAADAVSTRQVTGGYRQHVSGVITSKGQQRIDIIIDPDTGRYLGKAETDLTRSAGAPAGTMEEGAAVYSLLPCPGLRIDSLTRRDGSGPPSSRSARASPLAGLGPRPGQQHPLSPAAAGGS